METCGDIPRYRRCKNCGMIYDLNETPQCPLCYGKARERIWYNQKSKKYKNISKNTMKKERKIKPKYLACIWCGKDIPKDKPYAMYCSKRCRDEAQGKYIFKKYARIS